MGQESPFDLPGLNLPLHWTPPRQSRNSHGHGLFPNALSGKALEDGFAGLPMTTKREFTMLQLMDTITDKPEWDRKIHDKIIADKWRDELQQQAEARSMDLSPAMLDYIFAELQHRSDGFRKTGLFKVYNGDVIKSDTAVSPALKERLKEAVSVLEHVPANEQDWHPGSNDQVLDLVHPSLFPLVYGGSRIIPDQIISTEAAMSFCGKGEVLPIRDTAEAEATEKHGPWGSKITPYSRKFQWLPCDLSFADSKYSSNNTVKITSYINNLHPDHHQELYCTLEQIISASIPLFNATLSRFAISRSSSNELRIPYTSVEYNNDPSPDDEGAPPKDKTDPTNDDADSDDDYWDRFTSWRESNRHVIQPEPPVFTPPVPTIPAPTHAETAAHNAHADVDLRRDFGATGLQVIIKLATIHLTPSSPSYPGGAWHVEGQLNEHICASAIYYYSSSNITPSRLSFRQMCLDENTFDIGYEQNDDRWLSEVFGCEDGESTVQDVGSVETREGRMVSFSNVLQHRVSPFELEDKTLPGHRKILAIFLVDPHVRIISYAAAAAGLVGGEDVSGR